ncbi:hypothetical protein [Nitrosomonas ureae]|uniref:Uncharacterized protein n=1 Tax=Nitrosomonas ureae TaxID=44577 RepID=A0A1H9ARA2_9PROT|nr:hypothetical protein [Nitrosomonas ureae]SEP79061.1 hypothetical protein SAMN05421510_1004107 [Nitrosomonas ureae]
MALATKNRIIAGVVASIGAILLAIIQFGPAWLPYLKETFFDSEKSVKAKDSKKLNYYITNIILENIDSAKPGEPNIRAYFHITAEVETSKTQDLYYEDRVKTGGAIEYIKSIPSHTVLNPTQWPENPTYLEYRINPLKSGLTKFDVNGIGSLKIFLDKNKAKFGPHIPENTDFALMTVDFSRLKDFDLPSDFSAQVEGRDADGSLQYGTGPAQLRNWYKVNKTVTIIARNLPKGSSLLFIWGEPI